MINKLKNMFSVKIGNYRLKSYYGFPNYYNRFPLYGKNIQLLGKLVSGKYPDGTFIDIGANIGDTIALWRTAGVKNHIEAYESNLKYFKLLDRNTDSNVDIYHKEVKGLDNEKGLINIRLLKTDTDGNDMEILTLSRELIYKNLPVIFLEFDRKQSRYLFLTLYEIGYTHMILFDNYGNLIKDFIINNITEFNYFCNLLLTDIIEYYDIALFTEKDFDIYQTLIKQYKL
jgi:hypothetical protein